MGRICKFRIHLWSDDSSLLHTRMHAHVKRRPTEAPVGGTEGRAGDLSVFSAHCVQPRTYAGARKGLGFCPGFYQGFTDDPRQAINIPWAVSQGRWHPKYPNLPDKSTNLNVECSSKIKEKE